MERWRALAAFGKPDDPMTEIARLVVHAAEASDDEEMKRRAIIALGLDGPKKAANNVESVRAALEELRRREDAARVAAEDGIAQAWWDLDDVAREGVPSWLYRQIKGHAVGDSNEHRQFLRRVAKHDAELNAALDWALAFGRSLRQSFKTRQRK